MPRRDGNPILFDEDTVLCILVSPQSEAEMKTDANRACSAVRSSWLCTTCCSLEKRSTGDERSIIAGLDDGYGENADCQHTRAVLAVVGGGEGEEGSSLNGLHGIKQEEKTGLERQSSGVVITLLAGRGSIEHRLGSPVTQF